MKRCLAYSVVLSFLLIAPTIAAQPPPFPSIFTGINYPLPDDIYANPFTNQVPVVKQGQVYVLGWAFSWLTGQQPTSMTASVVTWDGAERPMSVTVYWRRYRPDVSKAWTGIVLFGHAWMVSDYTGFVLVPNATLPLDTRYMHLVSTEADLPPTSNWIALTVVPDSFNSGVPAR